MSAAQSTIVEIIFVLLTLFGDRDWFDLSTIVEIIFVLLTL